MSYEIPGGEIGTLLAGADLTTKQFFFVTVDSNGVVQLAGDGEVATGVLQNKPNIGEPCTIFSDRVSKVVAGAAIANGANVSPDAAGKAKTSASGNNIRGQAFEAAGADLEIIAVNLVTQGVLA